MQLSNIMTTLMMHMRIYSNEKFVRHSGVHFDTKFMMRKFAMPLRTTTIIVATLMTHIRSNSNAKLIQLRCEVRDAGSL